LLGSVSRGVLAESKRPVAVIRGLASVETAVGAHTGVGTDGSLRNISSNA
jgi:hypothetical protein